MAGCGVNAAPYFRIFNPILQGEKFDRNGNMFENGFRIKKCMNQFILNPGSLKMKT